MTTSTLKMFGRPRFGLMVGMLFLFAGLFPQKAISKNGDGKGVKCYDCRGVFSDPYCYKEFEKGKTKLCPSGYCYQELRETSQPIDDWRNAWRRCAVQEDLSCLKDKSGMTCYSEQAHLSSCLPGNRALEDPGNPLQSGKSRSGDKETKSAYCLCNSDLCNKLITVDVTFTVPELPEPPEPEPGSIECYSCDDKQDSECHKSPEKQRKVNCPSGYCFEDVQESSTVNKAPVRRGCADGKDSGYLKCLKDEPEMCAIHLNILVEAEDLKPFESLTNCINNIPVKPSYSDNRRPSSGPDGEDRGNGSYQKLAACVCNSNLCNTRTSGGNAGGDPGYICAVVVTALLISFTATSL